MTIALVLLLSVAVGASIRRWWTLWLPVSIGAIGAVAIAGSGESLGDTPIPFVVVTATIAMGVGVLLTRPPDRRSRTGSSRQAGT
jgi:hypothetical protein